MKVTITTLTGENFELDVKPEDNVKQVKRVLYKTGKVSSQVRLLQGQNVLQDDQKLSEYNITQDGAVISALFEPDVDINIEVSTGNQTCQLVVPNSTSVMALKVQVCDVMQTGLSPQKVDLIFGDLQLENDMPLHFHGVANGSKLTILRPFATVTIEDNQGNKMYKRVDRSSKIRVIKMMLSRICPQFSSEPVNLSYSVRSNSDDGLVRTERVIKHRDIEDLRLYRVTADKDYIELDDDASVNDYKIKDVDKLYLLCYQWTEHKRDVNVAIAKTGEKLEGVKRADAFLSVKVRAQDQIGVPVKELHVALSSRPSIHLNDNAKITDVVAEFAVDQLIVKTNEEIRQEAAKREEEQRAEGVKEMKESFRRFFHAK